MLVVTINFVEITIMIIGETNESMTIFFSSFVCPAFLCHRFPLASLPLVTDDCVIQCKQVESQCLFSVILNSSSENFAHKSHTTPEHHTNPEHLIILLCICHNV